MTLVKIAPKKSFRQKTTYQLKIEIQIPKKSIFGQNLFWLHFLLRSYVHFWNQYEKTDLFISYSTY
jgi:hypothetical protein